MLETALLVVHVTVIVLMSILILLQKSEGGIGMGSGSMSGFMSARSSANFQTRTKAILAGIFFLTSVGLYMVNIPKTKLATSTEDTKQTAPKS